jgi:hypothetical protein
MTRLVLAMLSARRGAALTVFVLAVVAAAAAAAGPLFHGAAARAATTAEISAAEPTEQVIRTSTVVHQDVPLRPYVLDQGEANRRPGFDPVFGVSVAGEATPTPVDSHVTSLAAARPMSLVFRSGACSRLVAVSGRCISGANEVMLSVGGAEELGLVPGASMIFQPGTVATPGGEQVRLTLVGIYRPRDARDPYWAGRHIDAGAGAGDGAGGANAAFVTHETVMSTRFVDAITSLDLVVHRTMFEDPARLRSEVIAELARRGPAETVESDIPRLLDRIAALDDALTDGLRLATVPLVLLCWFVLYLAVASSAFRRRTEFGLAGLRGVPKVTRWWLSIVEFLVPLLAGGFAGYLISYVVGGAVASRLLPGDPVVTPNADSVWYALAAVGGAVAIGVLAQWRAAAAPVGTMLRQVPTRQPIARLAAVEVVVVVLAVAAAYQVRTGAPAGGDGLALLTPMLVALAMGLICARLVGIVAARLGRRALRRGRLGRALAHLYLARQPSQARLLAVLVTMFGVLGFAVTAADVGAAARAARVRAELGADRVVSVDRVHASRLLSAVREVDPDGRYAMAVARLPVSVGDPLLAVDADRLARVANWPAADGPSAADVARRIEPQEPTEVRMGGEAVELRLTVAAVPAGTFLRAVMLSLTGEEFEVGFGPLRVGPGSFRADTPGCVPGGCRLLRLRPAIATSRESAIDITIHELRQVGPERIVADAAEFARADRWALAAEEGLTGVPVAAGYRIVYSGRFKPQALLFPVGTPRPIPVASTEPLPATLDTGGEPVPVVRVGAPRLVPGQGPAGGLVSLRYADLAATDARQTVQSEVWLTSDAPADVLDRLRGVGLVIRSDRTVRAELQRLDHGGPALALRFYLVVAVASVAMGVGGLLVVATADRWAQARQLRALRQQGLSPGAVWRVGFGGYGLLIAVGIGLGTAAAAVAWWLSRTVIPFFTDAGGEPYLPSVPAPVTAGGALIGAAAILLVTAAVAAAGLRRAVRGGRS